jgi:5-methylcytosine-specific restriction protein A
VKLCTVCGVVTSRAGSRCTEHARQSNRSRHNALYSTRAWQRLSARVIRAWRGQHGNWCPGYQRDAHPATDLTVDHVVPLAAGGAPLDIANIAVLCRSCNSTKGAATDRGGVAREFRTVGSVATGAGSAHRRPRTPRDKSRVSGDDHDVAWHASSGLPSSRPFAGARRRFPRARRSRVGDAPSRRSGTRIGRGERARASGTRQIRGCRVTLGGLQGSVDLFLTA